MEDLQTQQGWMNYLGGVFDREFGRGVVAQLGEHEFRLANSTGAWDIHVVLRLEGEGQASLTVSEHGDGIQYRRLLGRPWQVTAVANYACSAIRRAMDRRRGPALPTIEDHLARAEDLMAQGRYKRASHELLKALRGLYEREVRRECPDA